jgi:formate hydrogenlyase transcriptional activator
LGDQKCCQRAGVAWDAVILLGELASALEARDLSTFACRVAAALTPAWPVAWLDLALRVAGGLDVACASAALRSGAWGATVSSRAEDRALLFPASTTRLEPLAGAADVASPAEVARARAAGACALLVVPILRRGDPIGRLVAALLPPLRVIPRDVLDATTHLISAGAANVALVARLAGLSRRAHRENRSLRSDLRHASASAKLIGSSLALRGALAAADAVAPYATPVLLRGESGTGKELLAAHVHERSSRARRVFLKVNCGAIPETLVDAELFGHERGAFTGAARRHDGIFVRADGGTVLLDEIGELPLASQVRLLRVLQTGEVHPVGGERSVRTDVRIIAATHRDLDQMVADGTFRADLFFRLNVFPIMLPPLRERLGDLPAIAASLLQRIAARLGRPFAPVLDAEGTARLARHTWPGNIRELENVLERAMILSPDAPLVAIDPPVSAARRAGGASDSLAAATRRHVEATLRACGGRIYGPGGAATRLGLPPSTLQSKMRRLGIRGPGRPGRA